MSTYPPQQLPPEGPAASQTPWGLVIGVIAVVLLLVVGLPILACVGIFGFGYMKARQVAKELESAQAAAEQAAQTPREDLTAVAGLADALYPHAKQAIAAHWTEPAGIRSRRWSDWQVRKLPGDRYEIHGRLETLSRQAGRQSHTWSCEFTPIGPASPDAQWQLQRVVVDGRQCHP